MDCSNKVYGGSSLVSLLHDSSNSLWIPSSSLTIHDTIVRFDHHHVSHQEMEEMNELEQPPAEKKRRLTPGQVEFLEKNFEVENKLEAERKMQLAKELGLEPRQVAIWFQNRRARFKIKQLEKGFECLKATYDQLLLDYQHLLKEKQGLQNEVEALTNKIKQRNSSRVNSDSNNLVNNQLYSDPRDEIKPEIRPGKVPKIEASMDPSIKQVIEDASSTKSDVLDSDSPHCAHGNHAPFLEDPNHIKILDPDEEKTGLMIDESLLFQTLPYNITSYNNNNNNIDNVIKIEDNAISCNFSLVEDQTFWSSLY